MKSGLPKAYAKLGFKEGWKKFHRDHGGKKKSAAKKSRKKRHEKPERVEVMAKRRKHHKAKSGKSHKVHSRKKSNSQSGFVSGGLVKVLGASAVVAGGAIATNLIISKIRAMLPASATAGKPSIVWPIGEMALGVGGLILFRNRWFKMLSGGAIVGGMLRGVDTLSGGKLLAGPGRSMTRQEFLALTGGMGVPAQMSRLGVPADMMRGVQPLMRSGVASGWAAPATGW